MNYIAHVRKQDGAIQTVSDHLLEVKSLCERFGDKLGIRHIAGLAGVLHDLGKYSKEFQQYIREAVDSPDHPPQRGRVDHSTAGGRMLYKMFHGSPNNRYYTLLVEIVSNAVISHHSDLQDFLNQNADSPFLTRVKDKETQELKDLPLIQSRFFEEVMNETVFRSYVQKAVKELKNYTLTSTKSIYDQSFYLSKFVFSTLIDADRTNSRLFEEKQKTIASVQIDQLFKTFHQRLLSHLDTFNLTSHPINQLRNDMSLQCAERAKHPSDIYTLSIPTGGGKTLASLRYALEHALYYGKKKIIYVVPYTTIIEQNAAELRKVLQDDRHILEHHSNVIESADDVAEDQEELDESALNRSYQLKLARDNWDSPIILTTIVQFLNVFYAKGNRNTRRLHQIAESIVIFDEVQKVPTSCVSLFNETVNFLKEKASCSVVLCTATQPALHLVKKSLELNQDAEMIQSIDEVIEAFRRVDMIDCATQESFNHEQLQMFVQKQLQRVNSVLVILNTKSVVKSLFEGLQQLNLPVYHLSTSMCAAHRQDTLKKVYTHLRNQEPVICISTQLIEAGVDISFQCVIRSLAGLDSIAQAAGRCNRNGEKEKGLVYIIDHQEEKLAHLREIQVGSQIVKVMLRDLKMDPSAYGGHLLSREAMNYYFQHFYLKFETRLDYPIKALEKSMIELITASRSGNGGYHAAYTFKHDKKLPLCLASSYKTASDHFKVIDQTTTSVIVPYHEKGKAIIAELNGTHQVNLNQLLKDAQRYSINILSCQKDELIRQGVLHSYWEGQIFCLTEGAYDQKNFGLNLENDSSMETAIF
ncbi:CRISPR-associated helicase Cas3' [Bacillus sp. YKCMOAS1]|uniref:CRISPR-associated helicase Cas3' n=1 Tax=Bacillus sp. YKCMOAS1 TaxID=2925778 RepID=UPI00253CD009|nr:CRISPR-associated helicase Cas3' [Bacillus sp. YKCMOAS1]GLJ03712.1 CRISPR-associated helicase/endonuclease Cas3 [Bacillus sp. YKCMOAS1]